MAHMPDETAQELTREQYAEVCALSERLSAVLEGQGGDVQSMALAHCVALWLSGHYCVEELRQPADRRMQTFQIRKNLMRNFVTLVMNLVPELEEKTFSESDLARIELTIAKPSGHA